MSGDISEPSDTTPRPESPETLDGWRRRALESERMLAESAALLREYEVLRALDEVIENTEDIPGLLDGVLLKLRELFKTDRAYLLQEQENDRSFFLIPYESFDPKYPGASTRGKRVPRDPERRGLLPILFDADGPVVMEELPPFRHTELKRSFQVQSEIVMALRPRTGGPWVLGMHQCSHPRVWQDEELRLFAIAARRINHVLGMRLIFDELKRSEIKQATAQSMARVGYWEVNATSGMLLWSSELFAMHGLSGRSGKITHDEAVELVHPDDRAYTILDAETIQGKALPISLEYRILRPDGEIRHMNSRFTYRKDEAGNIGDFFGVTQDVTERRQRELDEKRLRQRLAEAQEYGKAGVWDWDPKDG